MPYPLQLNLHRQRGRFYKVKREFKKLVTRKRRHLPIEDDECGGKNIYRCTLGWVD